MPVSSICVSTELSTETALKRIDYLARDLLKEYGEHVLKLESNVSTGDYGVELSLNGYLLKGQLRIKPGNVTLTVEYPWSLLPYKNNVQQQLTSIFKSLLS